MKDESYGFVFKPNGNSIQGVNLPGAEIFGGDAVSTALVRELGQNSLDAKLAESDAPVKMIFERRDIPTSEIPDVETLRKHAAACAKKYPDDSEVKDMVDCLNAETISVLRVGDYGTKGLTGGEGLLNGDSVLTALTRGSGLSVGKTDSGGSFGIGKNAGIFASRARTELWITKPYDSSETIFAATCQFTTHENPDSDDPRDLLDGMGVFTSRDCPNDYKYVRNPRPIDGFPERRESGTDTYILAYKRGADDEGLIDIRDAVIENFLVAIDRGHLEVEGHDGNQSWSLDATNLETQIQAMSVEETRVAMLAYYRALHEEPEIGNDKDLGEVKLYINMDDSINQRLDVICVRKPLMKVHHLSLRGFSANFAAVLECSSDEGNRLLRSMESARHDKWVSTRGTAAEQRRARSILKWMRTFAREAINKRMKHEMGETLKVEGLNLLLPDDLQPADETKTHGTKPAVGKGTVEESPTVQGKEMEERSVSVAEGKSVRIGVMETAAAGDGNAAVEKYERKHEDTPDPPEPDPKPLNPWIPSLGHKDDKGGSIMKNNDLTMRYWYESQTDSYVLVLRSATGTSENGVLRLVASLDGQFDKESVPAKILRAEDITEGKAKVLNVTARGIQNVSVDSAKATRLRVWIDSPIRLQLGVSDK